MPWQMWVFIVLLVPSVLAAFMGGLKVKFAGTKNGRDEGLAVMGLSGISLMVATLFLVFGCFTVVSTRAVGIVTTFSRPSGQTLDNGLHLKAPWSKVTEMDGAIQNDVHNGDDRIRVRLGNSSTADADVNVRWRIRHDAADELFVEYKTFDNVRSNLVTRSLASAMNETFSVFDPLAPENIEGADLGELSRQVESKLRNKVGNQVEILEVNVPIVDYDEATEERINQLNAERANTAVAQQAKRTAEEQAEANRILASSVADDPNVIVQNCITKALDKGLSPWGCWPGTGALPTIPAPVR